MIEKLKETGKELALELLKDEEIFEELSDLIIAKKISPVADAVLKEKIKPWLEETLPNYVSADDVLDFIKQYAWYSEYINEFVRLFDLFFDCQDLSYLVDISEEVGTQMTEDGIFQNYQEDFEETINDLLEMIYEEN